jgi:phospholipid N-methyltransferase
MIGSKKDFVRVIKEKKQDVTTTYCFLHQEVLVSKTIGEDLKQVLDVAVSMVNFINHAYLQSCVKVCKKTT